MSGAVEERDPGYGRLDRERAASLADEGGAAAIVFEARDFEPRDMSGDRRWPRLWPALWFWAVGLGVGFLAAGARARRRRRRIA